MLFLLVIVLSVLLRYTVYHCPFGIFKLFLPCKTCKSNLQLQKIKCIRKEPQTVTLPPPNAVVPIMFLSWNAVLICRQTRSSTERNKNRLSSDQLLKFQRRWSHDQFHRVRRWRKDIWCPKFNSSGTRADVPKRFLLAPWASRQFSLRVVFRGLPDRGCSSTIPVTRRSITEWCIPFVLLPFYC